MNRSQSSLRSLPSFQQQGLIRHLDLSNVTAAQIKEAQSIAAVVCVQNLFNVMHRATTGRSSSSREGSVLKRIGDPKPTIDRCQMAKESG